MSQSLSRVILHLVFATKNRSPAIRPECEDSMHRLMASILENRGCMPIIVNGVCEHVHILFCLSRDIAIADAVRDVKSVSSKWMREHHDNGFQWQNGYAVFSLDQDGMGAAESYIRSQKHRHRNQSYEDEFRELMNCHGVVFDERYAWD